MHRVVVADDIEVGDEETRKSVVSNAGILEIVVVEQVVDRLDMGKNFVAFEGWGRVLVA